MDDQRTPQDAAKAPARLVARQHQSSQLCSTAATAEFLLLLSPLTRRGKGRRVTRGGRKDRPPTNSRKQQQERSTDKPRRVNYASGTREPQRDRLRRRHIEKRWLDEGPWWYELACALGRVSASKLPLGFQRPSVSGLGMEDVIL
ncbi:hypothetical protein L596_024529 [Steinernema carpocapsae]|uniref:Uncharacterized protein n=1 Tax=Steinernema carpocapsae TaxID=34508 RepID=A0A4V6XVV6_STECR|nr:hypothetical protein L596_024529 [Steinernema carpocapsae]